MNITRRNLFSLPAILAGSKKEIPKFVSEVKALRLGPDDVIVYRTDACLSRSNCESLKSSHKETFGGTKAIVLTEGMDIGVISR